MATQKLELVKIICVSVLAVRDGDKIIGEIEGVPTPCFTPGQLQDYYEKAEQEVVEQNAITAAAQANGNRQQRRRSRKPKVPAE